MKAFGGLPVPFPSQILQGTDVGDVWGIGRRSVEKLMGRGIYTAYDLKRADEPWIRKHLAVVGARTVMELNEAFDEQSSYSNNQTITLPRQTASTPDLIEVALRCLKAIYRPGYRYRKAGVMLAGIVKRGYRQQDLFSPLIAAKEDQPLMAALDKINQEG